MVRSVSVVGKTNSGKTSFIERILPELKKRSYRVGVIKHDVHQFEIDHRGKDTWRIARAGADIVTIASSEKIAMVKNLKRELSIDDISEWLMKDVDLIITEGYKRENKYKIEVTRSSELLCKREDNLIAIIDNSDGDILKHLLKDFEGVPVFSMNEAVKVVDLIEGME